MGRLKRIWRHTIICVAGICGVGVAAMAQDRPEAEGVCRQDSCVVEKGVEQPVDSVQMARVLEELVVSAHRDPQKTATGEIYTLSRNARECGNPFKALSEIPVLRVDLASHSVRTQDGESPLILIDGHLVNSGIDPIDPKFIDSVEIIEVPNAKYLELGATKVLNIRLKRDRALYTYVELRTRHDVIPGYGLAGSNFEIGSPRFAVSGSIFGNYTVHNRTTYSQSEYFDNHSRIVNGRNISRNMSWDVNLQAKWLPNESNFFVVYVKGKQDFNRNYGGSEGDYFPTETAPATPYATSSSGSFDWGGTLAGAYYEHTFSDESQFTAATYYNWAYGRKYSTESEYLDNLLSEEMSVGTKSMRNQLRTTLDYDTGLKPWGNLSVGYVLLNTHDHDINRLVLTDDPLKVNLFDNYLHATYSNTAGKFQYMLSAGVQMMNVSAAGVSNRFWRPRGAASLSYSLPHRQNLRLSYTLSNVMPESSYLATFNTSVNPWIRIEGNPYLTPVTRHKLEFRYDKSVNDFNLYARPFFLANTNLVESYITQKGDVAVSSWQNVGRYLNPGMRVGTTWSYKYSIRADVNACYSWEKYDSGAFRGIVGLEAYVLAYFSKFAVQAYVKWQNKAYYLQGYTRPYTPTASSLTFVWYANDHIQVMTGMSYFAGINRELTVVDATEYQKRTVSKSFGTSMHPFILFAWTLRKHQERNMNRFVPSVNF